MSGTNLRLARQKKKEKHLAKLKRASNFINYAQHKKLKDQLERAQATLLAQRVELSNHNTVESLCNKLTEQIQDSQELAEF